MGFFDYFRVALKNLVRQKTRTFLTITAITVGSLSLILMASIIISIRQSLVDQFQQLGAFSLVTVAKDPNAVNNTTLIGSSGDPSEGKMMDDTTVTAMRNLTHVTEVTPILSTYAKTMRLEGQNTKTWANITGFDPANDVFNLPLTLGRKLNPDDLDKIIVGNSFVTDMGYGNHPKDLLGQHVILNMQSGPGSAPDWGAPPEKPPLNADKSWYESKGNAGVDIPVEIVGIMNNGTVDNGQSYITLAWARRLMTQVSWQWDQQKPSEPQNCVIDQQTGKQNCSNTPSQQPSMKLVKDDQFIHQGYSTIVLKVDDQANITAVSDAVKHLGYGANTAKAMLDQINQILFTISIVLAVIGGISLFVASIGIINTMIMATFERIREIGVMRACGATRGTIRKLFTFEAGLLGFWGGVFGLVISIGIGQLTHLIVSKTHASLGNIPIEKIGNFPWWLIVSVMVFTSLLGMVAGLYPAIRASRMDPVEALRYE